MDRTFQLPGYLFKSYVYNTSFNPGKHLLFQINEHYFNQLEKYRKEIEESLNYDLEVPWYKLDPDQVKRYEKINGSLGGRHFLYITESWMANPIDLRMIPPDRRYEIKVKFELERKERFLDENTPNINETIKNKLTSELMYCRFS